MLMKKGAKIKVGASKRTSLKTQIYDDSRNRYPIAKQSNKKTQDLKSNDNNINDKSELGVSKFEITPRDGESNEEDKEDYDKKLQEIQEKYKQALNLTTQNFNEQIKSNQSKGKLQKKASPALPFSVNEFRTIKAQVEQRKNTVKPETR